MSFCSSSSTLCCYKPAHQNFTSRFRPSSDVPDFLSAHWLESRRKRPFGPRLSFSAEEAVGHQLDALMFNDQPRQDYGIEVMYRVLIHLKGLPISDPFLIWDSLNALDGFLIIRSTEYCLVIGREILSSLQVEENLYKQRVWILGARPEEEETFQFTMVQRVGGCWDGYWLTESVLHDGDGFTGAVAY